MFKRLLLLFSVSFLVVACSSRKSVPSTASRPSTKPSYTMGSRNLRSVPKETVLSTPVQTLLSTSYSYLGTPYKFGGTETSGMDCSGLVFKTYEKIGKKLPRISREMGKQGREVSLENLDVGDLVFFGTGGASGVNHVGLVHQILPNGEVRFIHSSSSKGVIISSLDERYWNAAYLFARRMVDI